MTRAAKTRILALGLLLVLTSCTPATEQPSTDVRYWSEEPPGSEPKIFKPGLVSTHDLEGCCAFLAGGRVCVYSSWENGTRFAFESNGVWSDPQPAPWQNENGLTDFTVAPDGKTIYFQTGRPTSSVDERRESNTWTVQWTGEGWTEALPLPCPPNSAEISEGYPSIDSDNTLYFFTSPRGSSRVGEISRSRFENEKFLEAELLPDPVNSIYHEVDPVIAPDGSYILFGSGRPGGYGLGDLYVSFAQDDGSWTNPVNGGELFNSIGIPVRLSISADGKYLFFPSQKTTAVFKGEPVESDAARRWGDTDVYWMSTKFISELRASVVGKESAAEQVIEVYEAEGREHAGQRMSELYHDASESTYFELSELMMYCSSLIASGKTEKAQEFFETLLGILPDQLRIRQGYAVANILNGRVQEGLKLLLDLWQDFPEASSKTYDALGILHYQLSNKQRPGDELLVMRFIAEQFPESDAALLDLARAYESRTEIQAALNYCALALEINPDNTDAVEMKARLEKR